MGDHITSIDSNINNAIPYYGTFMECSGLKSITLSDNLTTITNRMFTNCGALTSITFPKNLTSIKDNAFENCTNLQSVELPENLDSIGNDAFNWCIALSSITRHNNITTIGRRAFYGCKELKSFNIDANIEVLGYAVFAQSGLTSITIPSTLKTVGSSLFYECYSLTEATFYGYIDDTGENINRTEIPEGTFSECSNLTNVTLGKEITKLGTAAFAQCPKLKPETVLGNIKNIGESAFYGSKNIKTLTLPDNVTTVSKTAFAECDSLETVTLGENTTLGEGVFMGCELLKKIEIGSNNNYKLQDGVLFNSAMTELVLYPAALNNGNDTHKFRYKVPASVTKIAPCAFNDVENLKNIALPDGLLEIGWKGLAFDWESMTIPSNVTKIGEVAFTPDKAGDHSRNLYFLSSMPNYRHLVGVTIKNSGTITDAVSTKTQSPNHKKISVYVKSTALANYASLASGTGDKYFKSVDDKVPLGTVPASGWKSIGRDFDVDLSGTNIKAYVVTSVSNDGKKAYMGLTKVMDKDQGEYIVDDGTYIPSRTGKELSPSLIGSGTSDVEYDKYTGAVLFIPEEDRMKDLYYKIGENEDAVLDPNQEKSNCLYPAVVDTYTEETEIKKEIIDGAEVEVEYCNLALNGGVFKQYSDKGITGYNKTILQLPKTMMPGNVSAGSKIMLSLYIDDEMETTDVKGVAADCGEDHQPWFTLAGQKIGSRPSVKGIYIHNGNKVVIK